MQITGRTRVFLILGDPVEQVRAPEVFNHLWRRHGVDAVLVPAHVSAGDLPAFARAALKAQNIAGLWITIPHKAPMLGLLDRVEPLGRAAGAVNAARRNHDGSIEGALFDGVGFVKALDHLRVPVAGRRALVVGIGGAGVAIATSLAEQRVAHLALVDTVPGRANEVASRVSAAFGIGASAPASAAPAGFDLVVNATPLGLRADDPLPFDVQRLDAGATVIDILMKNQPTPLVRACRARGVAAHPGFEMMVQQMPEYLEFFGFGDLARTLRADSSEVRALLVPHLEP